MQLFADLFLTDYGLVAVLVTLISLALAIGFHLFIRKKMREPAPGQAAPTAGSDASSV